MGLILQLGAIPAPRRLDEAHYRLTAGMNVDMLNRHLLLIQLRGNGCPSGYVGSMSCVAKVAADLLSRRLMPNAERS
jgi:hypothetical protein